MFGLARKPDLFDVLWGKGAQQTGPALTVVPEPSIPVITLDQMSPAPARYVFHDGEKFPGGYGPTELLYVDYWTLRSRSAELYRKNLFARGLVRRLVTNEVNTGLHLEATPDERILGYGEDGLAEWAETIENRFRLWEKTPKLCDQREQFTFGALQAMARLEALVVGDVLVVLRQDRITGLPRVQLINGSSVQSPTSEHRVRRGHRIFHGVELDSQDRQVAYWVLQDDFTNGNRKHARLPAYSASGRRNAWLVYGTDKRHDDVRGEPILALALQGLKEIDRYRDATLRKAVVNSMIAMFIKRDSEKPGSAPITGGAVRRGKMTTLDTEGEQRKFNVIEQMPGLVLEQLQEGEEPQGFLPQGTDEKYGPFEESILRGIAWANEVPPESLQLSFSSNYSASQAATNEFKMYLNKVRTAIGEQFCQPIYEDWLVSETLQRRVAAPGFLEAWRDPSRFIEHAAWLFSDWSGHIKPSIDMLKQANAYAKLVEQGFITRDRAAREITGTKYSHNVKKLLRENHELAEALAPIIKLEALKRPASAPDRGEEDDDEEEALVSVALEYERITDNDVATI